MSDPDDLSFLSDQGRKNVIEEMATSQLIDYSLRSASTKTQVESIHRQVSSLEFHIDHTKVILKSEDAPDMEVRFVLFRERNKNNCSEAETRIPMPNPISIQSHAIINQEYQVTDMGKEPDYCTWEQWLCHLRDIFHCQNVKLFFKGNGSLKYSVDSIKELFKGFNIIGVGVDEASREDLMELLETFKPTKDIRINYLDQDILGLIPENLDFLKFGKQIGLKAEELLALDSKVIEVHSSKIIEIGVQQFIKNWKNMTSNVNLEFLSLRYEKKTFPGEDRIIAKIPRRVLSKEGKRFRAVVPESTWSYVSGAYELKRVDGKMATVVFEQESDVRWIKFYVHQ
ncbi:hypothetical protein CRE_21534 [Caenorhabditis remanei]|uniref:Sdz-33 F-box domain-containing protein n=1 Tax=Caenorhabditis remanei TaxID=31234 RepID=E3NCQ4_CAERE|nr:hypothetical protein CRE_21534 [Caenorhabditis remanei]